MTIYFHSFAFHFLFPDLVPKCSVECFLSDASESDLRNLSNLSHSSARSTSACAPQSRYSRLFLRHSAFFKSDSDDGEFQRTLAKGHKGSPQNTIGSCSPFDLSLNPLSKHQRKLQIDPVVETPALVCLRLVEDGGALRGGFAEDGELLELLQTARAAGALALRRGRARASSGAPPPLAPPALLLLLRT